MPNFIKYCKSEAIARKIRNKQRKKNYQSTQGNPPRPWNYEEDIAVLKHEVSDRELALKISRSVQAIQIRRCRLNKLTKSSE